MIPPMAPSSKQKEVDELVLIHLFVPLESRPNLLLRGFLCSCPTPLLSSSDACLTFRTQRALRHSLCRYQDLFWPARTTLRSYRLCNSVRRGSGLLGTARATLSCGWLGVAIEKSAGLLKLGYFSIDGRENLICVHFS